MTRADLRRGEGAAGSQPDGIPPAPHEEHTQGLVRERRCHDERSVSGLHGHDDATGSALLGGVGVTVPLGEAGEPAVEPLGRNLDDAGR